MAFKDLLDQMLAAGKDLATQGQGVADQHLKVPPAGPERDQMLANLGKGALGGAALAVLLGTRGGRRVTGTAATLGGVALLGKVAMDAYNTWKGQQDSGAAPAAGTSVAQLSGDAAEQRSQALFRAMIAAAKADGHIDDAERAQLARAVGQLGLETDTRLMLDAELARPLSAAEVAAGADSPAAAAEIYLTSLFVIDVDVPQERAYLDELAGALRLEPALAAQLETQARAA